MKNYYSILGVKKSDSQLQIKKEYRKLAKRYHPDTSDEPNAEAMFKEVAEAYSVIGDAEKRKQYDNPVPKGAPQGSQGFGDFFSQFSGGFEDIFQRQRQGHAAKQKPANLRYRLNIDFEGAALGKVIDLKVDRMKPCKPCKGTGATSKTETSTCKACQGQGSVTRTQGFFQTTHTCNECKGTGSHVENPCQDCRGEGVKNFRESVKVNIPAGVASGNVIKVQGYGHQNVKGSPPGDLFLEVRVASHIKFDRIGNDIHTSVDISVPEAVLGCRQEVETVRGNIKRLMVSSCTAPGTKIKIKGEGVNGGDHIVTVNVVFPKTLSKELETAYEQVYEVTHPKG